MKNPIKNNTGQNLTRIKNIKKSKNLKVLEKLKNATHITHRLTLEPHRIIPKMPLKRVFGSKSLELVLIFLLRCKMDQ